MLLPNRYSFRLVRRKPCDESPPEVNQDPLRKPYLYFGNVVHDNTPVIAALGSDVPHGLVAGPTGSGKTAQLLMLISQAIMHRYSIFILDMKGLTHELLNNALDTVNRYGTGHEMYWFTNRAGFSSHRVPLQGQSCWQTLTTQEQVELLLAAAGFTGSTEYGIGHFEGAAYELLLRNIPADARDVGEIADVLSAKLRNTSRSAAMRELEVDGQDIGLLVNRLARVAGLQTYAGFQPGDGKSFDFASLFSRPTIFHASLPTLQGRFIYPQLGRFFVSLLIQAAIHHATPESRVLVVFDESRELASKGMLESAFAQLRGLGIRFLISAQSLDDLGPRDSPQRSAFLENTPMKIFHKVLSPNDLRDLEYLSAQRVATLRGHAATLSTESEGRSSFSYNASENLVPRLPVSELQRIFNTDRHFVMHYSGRGTFARFNGIPVECSYRYHISQSRYEEFCQPMNWPSDENCFVVPNRVEVEKTEMELRKAIDEKLAASRNRDARRSRRRQ